MTFRRTSVRHRIYGAIACGSMVALAACGGSSSTPPEKIDLGSGPPEAGTVKKDALKGITLSFVSWGGEFQDGQMKAAFNGFGAESGAKIVSDGPTSNAKIKAQVESGNVSWDVIDQTAIPADVGCGTLYQPLDKDIIDFSHVPEELQFGQYGKCGVPSMLNGMILIYNTKKYGVNPPKSWVDFFDTKTFPGKRGVYGVTGDVDPGVLEPALLADGVPEDQLYPLDISRALKKMSSIRKDIVFWKIGSDAQQLVEAGEVDMAMMWSGRAGQTIVKNGAPFAAVWNQWFPIPDVLVVPKGAKNPKASMAAINYYLGAKQQAKMSELTSYSGVNKDSDLSAIDPKSRAFLPTEHPDQMVKVDAKWYAKNYDKVVEQYGQWMAGS